MGEFVVDVNSVIRRWVANWPRIVIAALVAGGLTYGATFLMPSWYRSTALLLPPEETDQMDGGLSVQRFLSRMPSLGAFSNYYTPADIFRAILSSRSVQEAVIRRYDLVHVYGKKSMESTLKEFRNNAKIELAPDGTITVAVEDRSRQRAADMANALVEELDRFNVERRNHQAKRTRIFLERRVAETDSLAKIEESRLSAYQRQHHVLAPVNAEAQDARPLADLMALKMARETQLQVLRSYLSSSNEVVVQTQSELDQLKRQIAKIPTIETDLGRLASNVRLYQQVNVLLNAQLEDARLRETMDVPTVTVLDSAVPSERRSRPLRLPYSAIAALLAGLGTALWGQRHAEREESAEVGEEPALTEKRPRIARP